MDSYDKQQIVIRYMTKRMMKKFGMTKHNAEIEVAELLGLHPEELEYSHPEIDWDAKHEQMIPELERKNIEFLNEIGLDYASIWTTPVMLRKSTIDATAPVRVLLKAENFHDYATQPQGQEFKVMRPITMVGDMLTETKISLYRPVTKTGDPRCWVYGMTKMCSPGDELVFIFRNKKLYLLNISRFDYRNSGIDCELFSVIELSATAKELLEKIKTISDSQYLPVTWRHGEKLADTDVGRAIETALGININSSKKPDYKGIELKSYRKSANRHTLFTQVPDWKISKCPSIADFVAQVGYPIREAYACELPTSARELRCTVYSLAPNSQDLKLVVDTDADIVVEVRVGVSEEQLLVWTGEKLRSRLKEKHPETFWIKCDQVKLDEDNKGFIIKKIIYTSNPKLSRFLSLIEQGVITLDHMIGYKKDKKNGKYALTEKGPAWKIWDKDFNLLFPAPQEIYSA